jgi:hypothetical protein
LNGSLEPARLHLIEARFSGRRDIWSKAIGWRGIFMGYVHPDKPDIFLSYAHVDDKPDAALAYHRPGWVTTLVRTLEGRLEKKLGRVDAYDLWRDAQLAGHQNVTPEIVGRVRAAAVLLLVLSPGYLASEWCLRELAAFHEEVRRKAARRSVFVVEFDRVERDRWPSELAGLKGYRFWTEDPDNGNTETLGYPIVRDQDVDYFKRIGDLCNDLTRELKVLKECESPAHASDSSPGRGTRAAVYLAEVTEDLETRREAVSRHLDQAGFRVLPEAELPRDHPEAYRIAVDKDLAESVVFVQLLSEAPGRRFKGSAASYVAVQHERALATGRPVLQWRRRELVADAEEIPDDHRQRLGGATVVVTDLSEFKGLIVETVKGLTAPRLPSPDPERSGDVDRLIFVNAEETDLEAARAIIHLFASHGVGALPPVRGSAPDTIRAALKTRMLACDGMILVHGTNPDWPVLQWTQFRKVKAERDSPIRAVGICDLPPPDRSISAADVLHIPSAYVIDCRDGLAEEKFAAFLKAL